ncbi:MAG: 4-(cytidine 5'-diphospho)-2-C-methyl-D-erythritol kinase [Chloroflexi bacterium]|nr:4-(cytidine 5'-diphospho)-2-C-methyl-D-erythritol kinase [Chloroflexota bacterium]
MLVSAFAKLNLSLEILGKRSDGYHEVRTVMQTVDLCDEVEVLPASQLTVTCDSPELDGESNLAWKAALNLARHCGRLPLASVSIRKHIPVGMGLGGGSSDAAAVLVALNRLWKLALPLSELAEIGEGLGSDVPFFLWGGAAVASGRGEIIEPLPAKSGAAVTLICPNASLEAKTSRMYSRLMPYHYSDGGVTLRLVQDMIGGYYGDGLFTNAFENVAFAEFDSLTKVFNVVESACGRKPHLTGAGPGLFLLPSSREEHSRISEALPPDLARAYFVRTLGRHSETNPAIRLEA